MFGGVRSQETQNPEWRQMMTCKSEFYHEEMRRWVWRSSGGSALGGCRANQVAVCRWMVLDDQNLCIQTSSSFIYGALPIRGDIYVVGDLDTGECTPTPPAALGPRHITFCPLQEPTSTTSGSSGAAPGGGTAPCPCCPRTCPSPPAPPCASLTADSSTCSCARGPSACESSWRGGGHAFGTGPRLRPSPPVSASVGGLGNFGGLTRRSLFLFVVLGLFTGMRNDD